MVVRQRSVVSDGSQMEREDPYRQQKQEVTEDNDQVTVHRDKFL